VFVLIVFLVLLGSITTFAHAAQTFTVPPGSKQAVNVNLNQGDSVNGTISVSGGTGTGVDFTVTDPNGKELLSYNYTSYTGFSFSASINGTYILGFDNSFCSCFGGKNVTLDYSVNDKPVQASIQDKSNGEFPTDIALIVVIVIVAISAIIILMRRQTANTNNGTASHSYAR